MGRKKSDKGKEDDLVRAGIAGSAVDTVQRYGAAAKEHLVAYSGVDNEIIDPTTGKGMPLQKSLKSISEQDTNPDYEFQIRQQKAGWAAEVKDTAKTNAENIIKGNKNRKIRHDDLPDTPANHPLYDHVEIDDKGNVIVGSGTQMKFIGASKKDPSGSGNAERALKKLQSKGFQKYLDNDVKIEVPSDEYEKMKIIADQQIKELQKQLQAVKSKEDVETAANIEEKISKDGKKKTIIPSINYKT